ncbi:MAG: hypothetical protein Q9213_004680 [Squamulea squamosa]
MAPIGSDNDKGATGAAKFVTSTVGNTVGGLGKTVGGVVGAGGRGLGQTITGATGSAGKPIGDAIESLGNGVENGAHNTESDDEPIRPSKRQRLSHADLSSHIDGTPQDNHDDTLFVVRSPTRNKENEDPDETKAKKPKYRIHVPTDPRMPEDAFFTQPPPRSPSPYRIDKFCWQKPTRARSPTASAAKSRLSLVRAKQGAEGSALALIRTESNDGVDHTANSGPQTSSTVVQERTSKFGIRSAGAISANLNSNYDDVLGDLPSDAFSSPEPLERTPQDEAIMISSQDADSQARPSQCQRSVRMMAPPANLRQTTLFGTQAQETVSRSQPTKTHNWPLANKEEPPTHHKIDRQAMATWVYPTNLGKVRDYQYSIVARGLYHNMLVALPTGLGKTFIAAAIMLNWFRWTKDAQIVFVAPTKPLVTQQIKACFEIAGIPRSTTTLLTGATPPEVRAEEWLTKRVFFMTPQTIINDLKTGICNPKRLVLLVVDEAHRATGGYAYVEVVQFLRRFSTSFRVLALTATPGSSIESVQEVIDGLGISRIEIRTEESFDIRDYVHCRKVETVLFEPSEEMIMIMDLFSKALQPLVDKLCAMNAYWGRDPMTLTPYGCTQARTKWMSSDAGRKASFPTKGMVNQVFSLLASLSHGTELLKFHGIGPFYRKVVAFRDACDDPKGKVSKYRTQVNESEPFRTIVSRVRGWINNSDFVGHPKLEYLQRVVLNHFLDAGEGRGASAPSSTRVMVFAHYRDSAEEIAHVLKRNDPMIRPRVFVGQANSKGSEGMDQKTQLDVIQKFQSGIYNTLVATSIGEEGLDIGEVDLIVCYDASASPIRMLQRMGRTGRKRAGNIVVTLMKGKEENNFIKAKDNYEKMQHEIATGVRFSFRDDLSHRIVPKEIHPIVDKKVVDIPFENTQADLPEPRKRARAPKRPPKKFHMPDGVRKGFVTATKFGKQVTSQESDTASEGQARRPEAESPEPLPSWDEVLLGPSEQRELERRYLDVQGDDPRFVEIPRVDAFPTLQMNSRPTKHVRHGRLTERVVRTLKLMNHLRTNRATAYEGNLHPGDQRKGLLQVQERARISEFWSESQSDACLLARSAPPENNILWQLDHESDHSLSSQDESLTDDVTHPIQRANHGKPRGSQAHFLGSPSQLPTYENTLYQPARTAHRNASGWEEDDLPDCSTLIQKRGAASGVPVTERTSTGAAPLSKPRKRRKVVIDDDSDE